jgi:toxin ParE1/3/4
MKVRFTFEALTHINGIHFYIGARSPVAAKRIVARIFGEAERLGEFARIGHAGVVPGTYEWTVTGLPYIIVHELDDDKSEVIVLGVFHGMQHRR